MQSATSRPHIGHWSPAALWDMRNLPSHLLFLTFGLALRWRARLKPTEFIFASTLPRLRLSVISVGSNHDTFRAFYTPPAVDYRCTKTIRRKCILCSSELHRPEPFSSSWRLTIPHSCAGRKVWTFPFKYMHLFKQSVSPFISTWPTSGTLGPVGLRLAPVERDFTLSTELYKRKETKKEILHKYYIKFFYKNQIGLGKGRFQYIWKSLIINSLTLPKSREFF